MTYYKIPSSRIIKNAAFCHIENNIYNGEQIAAALAGWGLPCVFISADTAPQLLTYHFDLKNHLHRAKVKRYIMPLSALLRCKVEEQDSVRGAHFALSMPRPNRLTVPFCTALLNREYNENTSPYAVCFGYDTANNPVIVDIAKAPHLLIAGATGSGKSVCLNTLINSLLFRATPNKMRLLMVDTKKIELSAYDNLPHLYAPIATDGATAVKIIAELNHTMRRRQEVMRQHGVTDIAALNYPRIFLVIDELADLILMKKEEVEPLLINIAQLGRAAGIHLILATQRPTVDVVTGLLKANIPCRLALQTASMRDSMTILDHKGAERLTGRGDALLKTPNKVEETRLQVAFIDREDIDAVAGWWRSNGVVTA